MRDFFKGVRKHITKLDATLLREQYERISEEVESLDAVFNAIDRGIIVIDEHANVTLSNPAAKELLGMEPTDAVKKLGILPGKSSKREISISYPERRSIEVRTMPAGSGTLVYLRDTTAEKARTEEELRVGATRAVCDLAAGVAHEIGNPLNAIALNIQMLERDPTDREAVEICKSQIKRLDGIIRDFLSALRPTRPNLSPGSLADPLKDCLATLRAQFEERRIRVTLDVPSSLPVVAIDGNQMVQVFFNIIKNALEAMKDGGSIAMSISSDDNDVSVKIVDSGEGIPSELLAHLFEPYKTTKERGTGLGLMISKRIVDDHGGTIDVESEVGRGTAFTVRIPRLERRIRELK